MRLTTVALLALALAGLSGLVLVLVTPEPAWPAQAGGEPEPEEPEPLELLEVAFAQVCYGTEFKEVHSVSGDTLALSMDLRSDSVALDMANLHVTGALRDLGFSHEVTRALPGDEGLAFICGTPDGTPARFELRTGER